MLQTVLVAIGALITGGVVALTVIAPLTKNTVDDAVLAKLQTLEDLLKKLQA